MNVLMFGWEFPPNISGGLGTACYGIVKGLTACDDIKVTFVVPKAYGDEQPANIRLISADNVSIGSRTLLSEGCTSVTTLEVPSKLVPYLTPESFIARYQTSSEFKETSPTEVTQESIKLNFSGKYGPNLFEEINNYAIVARTIAQSNEFEVIHAHDWLTFPAAIAAKHVSGKPLVIHIHSTDFDRSGGSINPVIYDIEKQGMEEADQIITVSNLIKKRLVEQYRIPSGKITTVYNAIGPDSDGTNSEVKKRSKQKTVTFLGRITIQKGPEYFVEVARLVINQMKNVHFVMAGNGEMRNRIVELCAMYGIGDRFHFAGFLSGKEVPEVLRRSDIFIMPSVSEPFGIVPLEAMHANVPVIISLQSGVSELIRNVIKTDFWDVHAMADAVHGILKHRKLSKALISEGKIEVSKLSWELVAFQIRDVYLNSIKQAS
ncbi:MAG: glycosyltransferase family 4 protein [Bacteroidota bacterium]|nr:glycosyltransferase family 4 protein [Bacteroidota bacterium]